MLPSWAGQLALALGWCLFCWAASARAVLEPGLSTVVDVTRYGATGDGVTDDGAALQAAFGAAAAASATGNSVTIRLPAPGAYVLDRPLVLNGSNTFLCVEAGATLRWRWDKNLSFTDRWRQNATQRTVMLTVRPGAAAPMQNVSIGGGGTIDGQGYMWWPFRYHVYEYINEKAWPPYFITFSDILGLQLVNITILNPPMITIQTGACKNVRMQHLNITAAWLTPQEFYDPVARSPVFAEWQKTAPVTTGGVGKNGTCGGGGRVWTDRPEQRLCEPANTDGIDPGAGSEGVHIADVFIENGDDSIVMKPGWPKPQQTGKEGCTRDVLVERVTILRGMGANIGGMGCGCVDNITFRDIELRRPSLAGVEIKTENGKDNSSFISNVLYENVSFVSSLNASGFPCVGITAAYRGDGHGYIGQFQPRISNITFRGLDLLGCNTPVTLECASDFPCTNVSFEGVKTAQNFVVNNTDCTAVDVGPGKAIGCRSERTLA